jgi:hypothetical protein
LRISACLEAIDNLDDLNLMVQFKRSKLIISSQ